MYKIIAKRYLTSEIALMEVEAPRMSRSAQPGQFLIVRVHEKGERIPLTICDYNRERGTVTIVTQVVGASSRQICHMEEGESFADFVGPLGRASEFTLMEQDELKDKRFLFVAGGLGTAPVYPQVKYLHGRGAKVDVLIGAKTKGMLILLEEMKAVCDNLFICTDDGSEGTKGLIPDVMKGIFNQIIARELNGGKMYDHVVAIGPMIMMKYTTLAAKPYNVPLIVSLNTLMVDGTGMCGACRVSIGGKTKFACVDGPEFDAYLVDFDEAMRRQGMYKKIESEADHKCRIGLDKH
ncbi:MAG: sulfide/dihydroorotate dehydrogenase-like FAD/NAD-binding protein [Bacteroidales bacterium]|nr:sulfide/dihydroorotate dehydrogenase-like FAD/NAD-binding protein [Bacteroidales bacterium]MDD2425039.1 sulfide/dihydroorotate dehydrogenase-like FAD/NAD-binding protein [Bacteroidales bacterium]MDD3988652.1 sulfide/dihydroorotate dehydrogenase-like FAD/NAD-binding protein [Bacteroidales bacterium]MDD4638334.1 sulfide/dihydroorotate dehydrogenase-like FAD/NAD-binding protein [Bacteroidales bacterium]